MKTARRPSAPSRRMFRRAVVYALLFGIARVLGWRDYTSVLSGTAFFDPLRQYLGVAYLVLYAAALLAVPPCLATAAVLALLERRSRLRGE